MPLPILVSPGRGWAHVGVLVSLSLPSYGLLALRSSSANGFLAASASKYHSITLYTRYSTKATDEMRNGANTTTGRSRVCSRMKPIVELSGVTSSHFSVSATVSLSLCLSASLLLSPLLLPGVREDLLDAEVGDVPERVDERDPGTNWAKERNWGLFLADSLKKGSCSMGQVGQRKGAGLCF